MIKGKARLYTQLMTIKHHPIKLRTHKSKEIYDIIDPLVQKDVVIIEDVDFDVSHNSRIKGFMNLGQNLKSYRDNRFNELMDIPQDQDYLDSLGDLIDFNKEK